MNPELLADRDPDLPQQQWGDAEPEQGDLLQMDEEKAAKRAMKMWEAQHPIMRPLIEQWRINEWLRRGITGAKLIQDPATGQWRARPPSNVAVNPEVANKAASLCRKMTGVLTADPPAPEAVPGEGEGDDPSSAEFANRVLVHLDSQLRRTVKLRRAIDFSHNCASAFERFYYDRTAEGRIPIEVEAGYDPATGEEAQTFFDAEFQTIPDPMTGQAADRRPWPKRRRRYVRQDGRLTDERKEAATRWQGAIRSEIIRAQNVRLYPHTAIDIEEAYGAAILCFVAWGDVKRLFPKAAELPEEKRGRIFDWRPEWADSALPPSTDRRRLEEIRIEEAPDERLVAVLTTYFDGSKCPSMYPQGLYMVQLADEIVLHRDTWEYEDFDGTKKPLSIPLSQLSLFTEGRSHWPGVGLMEIIGPGNEARAAQIGSLLEYLDRLASVKTLIPTTSIINPYEYADRTKRFMSYDSAGGEPKVEQLPPYPQAADRMLETMTAEMNDASGLQETGQGLEASSVTSGKQAMTIIGQIQAALSPQAGAVSEFYLRGCRIMLQLVRAHYDRPRQLRWTGDDGRHKQRAWERSDLGSTTDVRLAPGSMSMLQPAQKAILAREYFEMGLLPPDEFRNATEKALGGTLALQDDPFRQRIRRQIEDWKDGPPDDWQPPQPIMRPRFRTSPLGQPITDAMGQPVPEMDPRTGQPAMEPMIDPATGQPMLQPDPIAEQLWAPVPSDTLPAVAQARLTELARLTATSAYEEKPAEWRANLDAEFQRMMMAANPPQPVAAPGQSESTPQPEGQAA